MSDESLFNFDQDESKWYFLEDVDFESQDRATSIVWENRIYILRYKVQTFCPYTNKITRKSINGLIGVSDWTRNIVVPQFVDQETDSLVQFSSFSGHKAKIQYNVSGAPNHPTTLTVCKSAIFSSLLIIIVAFVLSS